jgi:hypothetical protein
MCGAGAGKDGGQARQARQWNHHCTRITIAIHSNLFALPESISGFYYLTRLIIMSLQHDGITGHRAGVRL